MLPAGTEGGPSENLFAGEPDPRMDRSTPAGWRGAIIPVDGTMMEPAMALAKTDYRE